MNILFVCSGNTCRSPMAEALMMKAAEDIGMADLRASSAGIYASQGLEASMGAIEAMATRGIDLSAHRATQLTSAHLEDADRIICMSSSHRSAVASAGYGEKAVTLLRAAFDEGGDIGDPFGGDADEYEAVAARIEAAINALAARLAHRADE